MSNTSLYISTFKGIVVFILGEKEFCINVANVSAIIKPEELEEYYVLYQQRISLLKQYNRTFPLIDIKSTFGFDPKGLTSESRIILIDCDFIILGLYVDKVKEIITLDTKDGVNHLNFIPSEDSVFIEGVINFENRAMLFPNLEKICARTAVD